MRKGERARGSPAAAGSTRGTEHLSEEMTQNRNDPDPGLRRQAQPKARTIVTVNCLHPPVGFGTILMADVSQSAFRTAQ